MENETQVASCNEAPSIIEEFHVEELAIDGICGVY